MRARGKNIGQHCRRRRRTHIFYSTALRWNRKRTFTSLAAISMSVVCSHAYSSARPDVAGDKLNKFLENVTALVWRLKLMVNVVNCATRDQVLQPSVGFSMQVPVVSTHNWIAEWRRLVFCSRSTIQLLILSLCEREYQMMSQMKYVIRYECVVWSQVI